MSGTIDGRVVGRTDGLRVILSKGTYQWDCCGWNSLVQMSTDLLFYFVC